jgi:hypothetical protein
MQTNALTPEDPQFSCRRAEERIQLLLDGALTPAALEGDAHCLICPACRERISVARLMTAALAAPAEPPAIPSTLAESIVRAALADRVVERRTAVRRRVVVTAGGLALAAGVLLALWSGIFAQRTENAPDSRTTASLARDEAKPAPAPPAVTGTGEPLAPAPRAINLGEHISQAERALLSSSKSLTEPVAVAPQVLAKLTDALTRPSKPAPEFEAARISLLDLPEAAESGLQPVTAVTQKAFARLFRDLGGVQRKN